MQKKKRFRHHIGLIQGQIQDFQLQGRKRLQARSAYHLIECKHVYSSIHYEPRSQKCLNCSQHENCQISLNIVSSRSQNSS